MLYVAPRASNRCDEKMGNVLASYTFSPQYDIGITTYIISAYPTKTFTIAKKGVSRGLYKYEATVDQSNVKAPIPSPLMPDPICWAVTECGKA